jgi:hypothetical protein
MIPLIELERQWVRAIFDTLFPGPPHGELPLGAKDLDVDGFFDGIFAQAPFESALGLRVAIWLLGLAPLFVIGRFTTFDGLGVEERERVYLTMAASRVYVVRSLVIALKAIGSLLYCGDETVRGRILLPAPKRAAAPLVTLRTPDAKAAKHASSPAAASSSEVRHELV